METPSLQIMYVGRFIGPEKIADIQIVDFKTAMGSMVFEVTFENGIKELFPEKGLTAVVSDEIKDSNHVRDARISLLVPQILELAEEYNFPGYQMNHLLSMVGNQWNNKFGRAYNYLFFGDDSRYVQGYEPGNDFTLLDAKRVINRIPTKVVEKNGE